MNEGCVTIKRNKIKYYLYIYKKINDYIENSKRKVDEYNLQIKIVEETYCSIGACVNDGTPHSSSPFTDKILFQIQKKDEEIENLKKLIFRESEKVQELIRMSHIISKALQDANERTIKIVESYYFEKHTAIETCYLIGCSMSTFKRENNALLEKLEKETREINQN